MNKVVVVGCGNVGMAYAYALVVNGSPVDELVLIDIDKNKAEGEAIDLNHAMSYAPRNMIVKQGVYEDCNNAKIVCICAGKNQKEGETRNDLIKKNIDVFKDIISQINKTKFKGIYLVATNPLDTMTYVTQKLSNFPHNRVFGSGTTLDTARLKYLIAQNLKVNPKEVNAYVLGEHGDTEFVAWENAMVGGNKCEKLISKNTRSSISYDVRMSAYDVINKKGSTSYGIGMCLLKITNAILNNDKSILTVSCYNEQYDVYFSKPAIVGKNGIEKEIFINLSNQDNAKLISSIQSLQDVKNSIVNKLR